MYNSSGNNKDNSNRGDGRKPTVPPLFGLEAIVDQKIEKSRTPYYNQTRSNEDDSIFGARYIYSPSPIDKPSNSYTMTISPPAISPGLFNQNRYTFSPSYNHSPSSLILPPETPPRPQLQPPPLSMTSLLASTNNIELPRAEPIVNQSPPLLSQPTVQSIMPPPSSSPPSSSSSSYMVPILETPKFDDLPPLTGDLSKSSLFMDNNNNNNNNNITGLSGLLSKTTLDSSINNNNNNNNNDIPLFQYQKTSPLFDINNFISSLSSSSSTTTTTSMSNNSNNNNHNSLFSSIPIAKPQQQQPSSSSSSSSSITTSLTSSLFSTSKSNSYNNNNNNNANESFVPTELDIARYDELMKELVMCQMCAQRLQKVKCFSYNNGYICCSCSGRIINRKTLGDWEIEEQDGVLCKRLNHHKNRVSYMKKQANGGFKIETLCIFCRNMKSYEYYRKQESKSAKL